LFNRIVRELSFAIAVERSDKWMLATRSSDALRGQRQQANQKRSSLMETKRS
jgi:hypothetical protein